MESDKIIERLFYVVAKGATHKHYKHTVAKRKEYLALVAGLGLDSMLRQFVRRESGPLFDQRVRLTQHIVTAVSNSLISPFYKVPRSNSARRVLTYSDNDQSAKIKEVEGLLSKFWGTESWDDYMGTRFVELNAVDPNAFTIFEFKPFDNKTELVSPYPYEANSEMAVDFLYKNKNLQYLTVKDTHTYEKSNRIESASTINKLPKWLDEDRTQKGEKYTLYTKNQTFQLLQICAESETARGLDEGVLTKINGGEIIKLGEKCFSFVRLTPHNCDQVPAVRVGYARDLSTDGDTLVSIVEPAIPFLKKSVVTNSQLDLVAKLLAFPQQLQRFEECDAPNCHKGTNALLNEVCGVCSGSGLKATAPSAQDAIAVKMPETKEELIPFDQILAYVAPPVDVIKWQESYIEKLTYSAKRAMYNSDIFDRKQIADTATGKSLDMENVYDTLHPFAIKFGRTWSSGTLIIAKLADRGEGLISSYTFGKDFKLKTLDRLIGDLGTANKIGDAVLITHLRNDIANIIFSEKPIDLQRYQLKEMLNPFAGKSEKEILVLLSGGLVSLRDKVLHANFSRIFDELEIDYATGKGKGKDFYKLNRIDQRAEVYKKVDEIIATINEENPEPVLPLD